MNDSGGKLKWIAGGLVVVGLFVLGGMLAKSGETAPGAPAPMVDERVQIMREAMQMAKEAQAMQRERMQMMREQMEAQGEPVMLPPGHR